MGKHFCKKNIIVLIKVLKLIGLLLLVNALHVQAQGLAQKFELGFGLGAFNYKGDAAPYVKYQNTRLGGNIHGRLNFNSALSLRVGLTIGGFAGDDQFQNDPYYQQRNFSFSGLVLEFNSLLEYHFFDLRKDKKVNKFSPYVFGGLGMASISARTQNLNPPNSNHSIQPVLPFGVGIKHALNDRFTINYEFATTKTFSDHADALIDTQSQDNGSSNKLEQINYSNSDTYYYLGVSFSYRFIKVNCPDHYKKMFR